MREPQRRILVIVPCGAANHARLVRSACGGDMARPLGGGRRIARRLRMGRLDVRCQPWPTGQR
jgi:hypothetical protein